VAGQLLADHELHQQAPHRLHLRQRPAERNARGRNRREEIRKRAQR